MKSMLQVFMVKKVYSLIKVFEWEFRYTGKNSEKNLLGIQFLKMGENIEIFRI